MSCRLLQDPSSQMQLYCLSSSIVQQLHVYMCNDCLHEKAKLEGRLAIYRLLSAYFCNMVSQKQLYTNDLTHDPPAMHS